MPLEPEADALALADHLLARVPAILEAWHAAIRADPRLTTGDSLPRTQLDDHVPALLASFARELRSGPHSAEKAAEDAEQHRDAAGHGLQRWQQGYDLREVTREWGALHLCLVDELERYEAAHAGLPAGVLRRARRVLAELIAEGVTESTAQYFLLEKMEATGNVRDLEIALGQLREIEQRRAELWHEAAHDLRGNVGVVASATAVLALPQVGAPKRDEFLGMLSRNIGALHRLLDDVTDLARLQAGQEHRRVERFDAAAVLATLADGLRPMAEDRGLSLAAHGAEAVMVEGDPTKLRRIAQNLLINAIKYTAEGGVTLGWGDSADNDPKRWALTVQDTGPGFDFGPGTPLIGAIGTATIEARRADAANVDPADPGAATAAAPPPATAMPPAASRHEALQKQGEGIGLAIVKRLCELLDATVEVDSKRGQGTRFRVLLPRRYDTSEP